MERIFDAQDTRNLNTCISETNQEYPSAENASDTRLPTRFASPESLSDDETAALIGFLSSPAERGIGWHSYGDIFSVLPREFADEHLGRYFFVKGADLRTVGEVLLDDGLLSPSHLRAYMVDIPDSLNESRKRILLGKFLRAGCPLGHLSTDKRFLLSETACGMKIAAEAVSSVHFGKESLSHVFFDRDVFSIRSGHAPVVAVNLALRALLPQDVATNIAFDKKFSVYGEPFIFFLARTGLFDKSFYDSLMSARRKPGELTVSCEKRSEMDSILGTLSFRNEMRHNIFENKNLDMRALRSAHTVTDDDISSLVFYMLRNSSCADGVLDAPAALLPMKSRFTDGGKTTLEAELAMEGAFSERYVMFDSFDGPSARGAASFGYLSYIAVKNALLRAARRLSSEDAADGTATMFWKFVLRTGLFDDILLRDTQRNIFGNAREKRKREKKTSAYGSAAFGMGYDCMSYLEFHVSVVMGALAARLAGDELEYERALDVMKSSQEGSISHVAWESLSRRHNVETSIETPGTDDEDCFSSEVVL